MAGSSSSSSSGHIAANMAPRSAAAAATARDLTPRPAAAAAAQPAPMEACRLLRTLSEDEEFLVAATGHGVTDSEDTDELLGRVDWALAANSDDEHAGPPG